MSIEFISLLKGSFLCPSNTPESSGSVQSHSFVPASRSSTLQKTSASALGGLHRWVRQDRIDRGEIPGISTSESVELTRARKRIHELEQELEIVKRAARLLGEDAPHPKGSTR